MMILFPSQLDQNQHCQVGQLDSTVSTVADRLGKELQSDAVRLRAHLSSLISILSAHFAMISILSGYHLH